MQDARNISCQVPYRIRRHNAATLNAGFLALGDSGRKLF
jgi:hypothetical protein